MKKFLLTNILRPVCDRLGSSAGMFVAGAGASADLVTQVEMIVYPLCGLAVDLILRKLGQN